MFLYMYVLNALYVSMNFFSFSLLSVRVSMDILQLLLALEELGHE